MNRLRSLVGWLGLLFGSLGVILSVAALVGVWVLSQRVTRTVDHTTSVLTGFTKTVHERADLTAGKVGESREKVELLQSRLDETLEGQGIDPVKIREGLAELQADAVEINEWIELAGSTQEFVVLLDEVLGSVKVVAGADGGSEVAAAMAGGAQKVKEASGALEELREALDEMQATGTEPGKVTEAKPLLTRCADSLGQLESSIAGFADGVGRAEDAVEKFGKALRFRINLAAWVASFLLVWNGVAQACLVGWGRRFLGRADRGNN